MKNRTLAFALILLSTPLFGDSYSMFVIEVHDEFDAHSSFPLEEALSPPNVIKTFVQTERTTTSEEEGTDFTYKLPFIASINPDTGQPEMKELKIGTFFKVVGADDGVEIYFSHSELIQWFRYGEANFLTPLVDKRSIETNISLPRDQGFVIGRFKILTTSDGEKTERSTIILILVNGESMKAEINSPEVFQNPTTILRTDLKSEATIIRPGSEISRPSKDEAPFSSRADNTE